MRPPEGQSPYGNLRSKFGFKGEARNPPASIVCQMFGCHFSYALAICDDIGYTRGLRFDRNGNSWQTIPASISSMTFGIPGIYAI